MKNDQEEALDKILTANLARSVDFIKLAETKHAALLAFVSGWFLALSALLGRGGLPAGYQNAFQIALPLLAIAAFLSVLSFLPITNLSSFLGVSPKDRPEDDRNLLFFGDLSMFNPNELAALIVAKYQPADGRSVADKYVENICVQIVVTSKIAQRKFVFFNVSGGFVLMVIVVMGITAIMGLTT